MAKDNQPGGQADPQKDIGNCQETPEKLKIFNTENEPDDHINDDDRERWQWQSKYKDRAAIRGIRIDAVYVASIFILTLIALVMLWRGTLFDLFSGGCTNCDPKKFSQFAYYFLGGVFGGTLFGVKYLYKVVARGYWNIDRRLWRIFSPFLSGGLALAIGALIDAGMLGLTTKSSTSSAYFALGFISGYFADSALAKMQEIAKTIFGPSEQKSHKSKIERQDAVGLKK